MTIDCYLSRSCGSEELLKKNVALALIKVGVKAEVSYYSIEDAEALARGLSGSPSVFINGKELQPLGASGFS
jgi:hypothetical protein